MERGAGGLGGVERHRKASSLGLHEQRDVTRSPTNGTGKNRHPRRSAWASRGLIQKYRNTRGTRERRRKGKRRQRGETWRQKTEVRVCGPISRRQHFRRVKIGQIAAIKQLRSSGVALGCDPKHPDAPLNQDQLQIEDKRNRTSAHSR